MSGSRVKSSVTVDVGYAGQPLKPHGEGGMADPAELAEIARLIASEIA